MSSGGGRRTSLRLVLRRWEFNVGAMRGIIEEQLRNDGDCFMFWLCVDDDEVWEGERYNRRDIDFRLVPPLMGYLVAIAQGTGSRLSSLWWFVEQVGTHGTWYWLLYRRRGDRFRLLLWIRTGRPEIVGSTRDIWWE
jgi:hypothetical protein